MSNKETQSQDGLVLGDRLNYPYILANAILNFHNAIIKTEGMQSEQEVKEAALCLYKSIPGAWIKTDSEFKKEVDAAITQKDVDARKEWCGMKVGAHKTVSEEVIDGYKLYHACINVFQRRGLLSKTIFTEKIIPDPSDFEEGEQEESEESS